MELRVTKAPVEDTIFIKASWESLVIGDQQAYQEPKAKKVLKDLKDQGDLKAHKETTIE